MTIGSRAALVCLLASAIASCAPRARTHGAEVAISITDEGFEPTLSTVPKGTPLTLVFTRKSQQTCVTDVTIGRLGRTVALPLNQAVRVELPEGIQDTLSFTCPMDMFRGEIAVR